MKPLYLILPLVFPVTLLAQDNKNWIYFELGHSVSGKIIEHRRAFAHCGVLATTSVTIVKTEQGDTLRVLDMCNTSRGFKKGQSVKVNPVKKPPFSLSLPTQVSAYDEKVLRTTWGKLE